jgi:hypothetical protein
MSRRHPQLLWSPHERDTFAIGSSDGQHLRFYRFSGEDRGEHSLGDDGGDQHLGVQLLGGIADMQLKCMAWCPHVAHPWTFAVGTNSGRLVLHDCTPGNTLGSSASGRPTTAVCEFVPRIGPRVCFSAAWNPLQPLQVGFDRERIRQLLDVGAEVGDTVVAVIRRPAGTRALHRDDPEAALQRDLVHRRRHLQARPGSPVEPQHGVPVGVAELGPTQLSVMADRSGTDQTGPRRSDGDVALDRCWTFPGLVFSHLLPRCRPAAG